MRHFYKVLLIYGSGLCPYKYLDCKIVPTLLLSSVSTVRCGKTELKSPEFIFLPSMHFSTGAVEVDFSIFLR